MVNKITTPPTQNEVIDKINELVDDKQDTLVSGTNIKTVGGMSLLGSGNIAFPTIDSALSTTSTNPVQNKVITNTLDDKAEDNLVVHLANAETITGAKTFENTSTNASNIAITLKSDNMHKGTNPSSNHFNSIDFVDDSNAVISKFSAIQTSDGWTGFLAGAGDNPTSPQNNLLMIANGYSKLLLIPPTSSHGSCAVRRDFFNTEIAKYTPTASLATVATSGSYNDLSNKPTIPTVNNATLTIQKNGSNVATFTANASNNVTANISVPTVTSTYTATGTDAVNGVAVSNAIATKQDNLVSGTNIKTINGNSLLGSGNITIKTSSTPNVDGKTISYNSNDALQTIAVKNVRDNSTLPIWHGTEYQWNHGDPTTWYYWQTSVSAMWSLCTNVTGIGVPFTVLFENNRFIVCSYTYIDYRSFAYIGYSTDNGVSWQSSQLPFNSTWTKPFYHNGSFFMISPSGFAYSEDNCETWQSSSLPSGITPSFAISLTYGNGRLLAVLYGRYSYYDDQALIIFSTDEGKTWQFAARFGTSSYDEISNVVYGNGRFIIIIERTCRYSTDNGETWQTGGTLNNSDKYYIIHAENDKFIAFSHIYGIFYTTDGGLTWNRAYNGGLEYPIPAIGNNIYAVLPSSSSSRGVLRSLDKGETWEEIGNTSLGAQISYGNDTFMIVGGSSPTDTYYSTDNCLTWTKAVSQSTFRGNAAYGNGRFIGGGTRVPDSSPSQYYMNTFAITYDKCYTDTANPTTTSVVYSEPETVSSYTISSVTSGAITLSNNNTYYYNQSGNVQTYQTVGDAHPEYLCFIDGVGVKIGNTTIATNNSNS